VTDASNSGGIGAVNTTQRPPIGLRSHVYGDSTPGADAGSPVPGKVPAPKSRAEART
jgi:hypothetical protein